MNGLTQEQVDKQIGHLAVQLDSTARALDGDGIADLTAEFTKDGAEQTAVDAREAYVLAYAKAFLESTGAMDVRKQVALQNTHRERIEAETAERIVRGLVRRLKTIQSRIDAGRTRSANVRSEAQIARTGAWGS